jgi:hypothetical protein
MNDGWTSFNGCIIIRPIFELTNVGSNQELTMPIYVGLLFVLFFLKKSNSFLMMIIKRFSFHSVILIGT